MVLTEVSNDTVLPVLSVPVQVLPAPWLKFKVYKFTPVQFEALRQYCAVTEYCPSSQCCPAIGLRPAHLSAAASFTAAQLA